MLQVKLFLDGPVPVTKADETLQSLEMQINAFINIKADDVRSVSGPHSTYFPSKGDLLGSGQIIYTASVLYDSRD